MPQFNLNDYVTVDERIDQFWKEYPDGAIRTELSFTNNDGTSVAIRATVHKQASNALPDATGFAQESQSASGDRGPNRASWWENCETSAIGRALANLGMSISKQRPSRQEMSKVQRVQEDDDGHSASQPPRRDQPPANRPAPPARTTPPAAQPVAVEPLSPVAFKNLIERVWTQMEDGATLATIKDTLEAYRPGMNPAQKKEVRDQLVALQTSIAERDALPAAAALAPPAPRPASFAG